jgi:predicted DNA-binding transcriptional regulator AlpA
MNAPAVLTAAEVALRLGVAKSTFYARLPKMKREGFPDMDPVMERYSAAAVEKWVSDRAKMGQAGVVALDVTKPKGINRNAV